jgi:hypothetical protein
MKIVIEPASIELAKEVVPLAQKSWDECSEVKKDSCAFHGQRGFPVDPNLDRYFALGNQGSLIVMTLRDDDGVLRGFASMILYRSLHVKEIFCGNVDTFYVEPDYLKSVFHFMDRVEGTFIEHGVSIIGWPVPKEGRMREILQRRGYIADDVLMELKIKDVKKE